MLMNTIRDEETGEMVASDVIQAAVITVRFRNVAERQGKVNLSFNVTVPKSMQDSKWQLRFYPDMFILGDSIRLEPVIITGTGYRKAQLKGYQQYERFLSRIISDTTRFINIGQLELFLKRNIPQIYAFRNEKLFEALQDLSNDNAQHEYYITDLVEIFRNKGWSVTGVIAENKEEVQGVNDCLELARANKWLSGKINEAWMKAGVQFAELFRDGTGDFYRSLGERAVRDAQRLRTAFIKAGITPDGSSPTNQQFVRISAAKLAHLNRNFRCEPCGKAADGRALVRYCTAWSTKPEAVEELLAAIGETEALP